MTNDKPTLDDIVAKAQTIGRLRDRIREAQEIQKKLIADANRYQVDLVACEGELWQLIAAQAPVPSQALAQSEWIPQFPLSQLKTKRVPYPNAKRGDVVWVGRRKILGILMNKKGLVESRGKAYKCDPKDLYYPYPGEPLPAIPTSGDK